MPDVYVVLTGPPASGKSTLSHPLAAELGLPLLVKDTVKQALVDALGAPDVEASRRLGRASVAALLAVARETGGAVLDSVWVDRIGAVDQLRSLGGVVEVFCRADVTTMRVRYRARAREKGVGHFDEQRPDEELWPEGALRPLAGGWPVVEVDTTSPVDVVDLVRRVREAAG
ncbi:MAG: AAA family ATPase [Nocardioidaceae bacterium]|nr:AAA family ATPase [Nocardioidaceae bacterium]NUS49453.1 AAA family ATPase [Nocardioidaceae bacterium]